MKREKVNRRMICILDKFLDKRSFPGNRTLADQSSRFRLSAAVKRMVSTNLGVRVPI